MNEDSLTLKAYLDGVDHIAQAMETKWGRGRLPLLNDAETRAKFYRQGDRMRTALEACYASKVVTRDMLDAAASATGGMERAWAALDRKATEAGHVPLDPDVWEAVLADGSIAAIVQTNADASKVLADGRIKNVWTLDEVGRAIDAFPDFVRAVKETFPGATVQAVREKRSRAEDPLNDAIPF